METVINVSIYKIILIYEDYDWGLALVSKK